MAVNMGEAVGYLDLDISKFKSSLNEAQQQAESATKSMAEAAGKNLQSAGKSITAAGSALTKNVTVPIIAAGTAAVKTTADFDAAMSKVSAVSGATGDQLQALRDKAKEMGEKTKFSATESAQAFNYMAMAGWKTEEMLQGIDGIMALSAADGLDLATTSDIVTDALTAFGLSASDSTHFADVLAQASRNANTNVSMLGESFKYVAPVAGSLGYSVEDVSVALGLMANSGIKASQAGTSLRQALSQLIDPTDKVEAVMEAYDISLFDAEGQSKSLMEVMEDLRDRFGGITVDMEKATEAAEQGDEAWEAYANSLPLSDQEKMSALVKMFGTRAMPAMLSIINASETDFEKLSNAISNADGTAQEMADTMLNNLNGQLTLLKSALEGLMISLGELLMPLIRQVVSWIQQLVDKLNSLDDEQKQTLLRIAAIVAAVGPALLVIGKLIVSIGKVISAGAKIVKLVAKLGPALKTLVTAISGVNAAAVAAAAVVAALVAAFVTLWQTNEDFRNKVLAIWQVVVDKFREAGQKITDALNSLGFNFKDIIDVLWSAWEGLCDFIGPVFIGVIQTISTVIQGVVDVVVGVVQIITGVLKGFKDGDWSLFLEGIVTMLDGCIQLLIAPWVFLFSTIGGYLEKFGTSWDEVWQGIADFFYNIWDGIVSFFTVTIPTKFDNLKNLFTQTFDKIKEHISNVVEWLKHIFDFKWELPAIKLPHFSIKGDFSLNPPKVPSISVDWYRKAMDSGMILTSPTLFGYDAASGRFMGGGEAGSETVVGTNSLMGMIAKTVATAVEGVTSQMGGDIIIPVYVGGDMLDTYVVTATDRKNYRSGGR